MGRDRREIISLAKTFKITNTETKNIMMKLLLYVNQHPNSPDKLFVMSKILSNNLNAAFIERDKKIVTEAVIEKINPYAKKNKDRIIELYNSGLGYVKIHEVLLSNCENEDEEKEVISPSTIRTYLHEKWGIPKDTNRRIPISATNARRKQKI